MCTRFVYNGNDTIVGFNFDIDLSVWAHTIIEEDRFYIGIKMDDGIYHSFHGINKNGNVGTLLYVHSNKNAIYIDDKSCYTISNLTENYIKGIISFDEALDIVQNNKIVYAPDATMQAMFSGRNGRVLIIEPILGYRLERSKYSLITNYSVLRPETTMPYIVPGDDRFKSTDNQLKKYNDNFSIIKAFDILKSVKQEEQWATRVSFVYSINKKEDYYVLNNDFEHIAKYQFINQLNEYLKNY